MLAITQEIPLALIAIGAVSYTHLEIVTESMKVLDKVAEKFGHKFNYTQLLMGGCSIDANGVPLTDETIAACKASDAVLMGSIGGDTVSYTHLDVYKRQ